MRKAPDLDTTQERIRVRVRQQQDTTKAFPKFDREGLRGLGFSPVSVSRAEKALRGSLGGLMSGCCKL